MKLTFIGAAHEVTGSCHYLEACGKHILIDCGLEQGPDLYENQEIPTTEQSFQWYYHRPSAVIRTLWHGAPC